MTTDPAPRSRVEGLLEEGRRLLAAVEGMTPGPWHVRQGDEWTCDLATSETFGEWNVVSANKRRDECDANMAGIAALRNEAPTLIRSLCEALGEAVADAERYRWLRHGDNDERVMMTSVQDEGCRPFDHRFDASWLLRNEKLDAAIDAARGRHAE